MFNFEAAMIRRRLFLLGFGGMKPFQARAYAKLDADIAMVSKNADAAVPNTSNKIPSTIEIPTRKLEHLDKYNRMLKIPQAWVTSLDTIAEQKHGIVDLHPDVFRTFPRIDILHQNINWQNKYRSVSFIKALSRAEMPGGGRKPWPQKGLGKARHGSIRAPQWKNGGIAHGVRGPRTWFYMLPGSLRIKGLCVALTIKHAQDDLVIVDSLDRLPTDDASFLQEMAEERNWGYSVLFVDCEDTAPRNLALACSEIPSFNIMPVFGLNCFSMVKHETLVLTLAALERIEERILYHMHKAEPTQKPYKYDEIMQLNTDEEEDEKIPFV